MRFAMTEPSKLPHASVPEHQPIAGGIAARARAAAGPQYLSGLNPEQREAVETLDGPVLVLAGAGTGKTRVLTTRIAHILSLGRARPHEILSVTFTNKAAREMKLRLGQMLGHAVEGMPWLGTFHSIGGRILRHHAELAQLKSNFTVLDVDDQVRLLKQLLQAENIDDKRWPARMLAGLIDGWKNRGLTPSQVPAGEAAVFANGKGGKLYTAYQERLKILNAADFGDLLLENIRIFREHPDVLRSYQSRFRYILVDEYQDTNVAQYLWLRLLSQAPSPSTSPRLRGEVDARSASGEGESPQAVLAEAGPPPPPPPPPRGGGAGPPPPNHRGSLRKLCSRKQPLTPTLSPQAGRGRRPHPRTSAASATTTSRSMAGAAPRSITSCVSSTIFPAQKSFASSAITAPPVTSSPPPRT
jgi:DNA helicase-2/ATP-dependent DNA helicase PcrA